MGKPMPPPSVGEGKRRSNNSLSQEVPNSLQMHPSLLTPPLGALRPLLGWGILSSSLPGGKGLLHWPGTPESMVLCRVALGGATLFFHLSTKVLALLFGDPLLLMGPFPDCTRFPANAGPPEAVPPVLGAEV